MSRLRARLTVLATGCTTGPQANATAIPTAVAGNMTSITAEGRTYPAYVATSHGTGLHPALVLVHSFNELEPGYRIMCDEIAGDGFVVIAPNGRPTASSPGTTRSGPSSGRPLRSSGTGAISIPADSP